MLTNETLNVLCAHFTTLLQQNDHYLRLDCLGHSDQLGASLPITSREQLFDELNTVLSTLELWESIELSNRTGDTLFSVYSSDQGHNHE